MKMSDDLEIFPFQAGGEDRLFLARFEFPKYGEDFTFQVEKPEGTVAFVDFLGGFPIDCVEMLVLIGEFSSKPDAETPETKKVNVQPGDDKATAPVWAGDSKIFEWPEREKILVNLTASAQKGVSVILAPNLSGEPKPVKAHWWLRAFLKGGEGETAAKFPVPGEFVGLGVRMFPGEYWGKQKSSPFIYSGNWMDTVYLTGGRIKEVIEPTDEVPYPTYKIQWRKFGGKGKVDLIARPSDFAEYKVDDRVSILKDVATEKLTQLWKDDDMEFYGGAEEIAPEDIVWQIVPLSFYGLETPAE